MGQKIQINKTKTKVGYQYMIIDSLTKSNTQVKNVTYKQFKAQFLRTKKKREINRFHIEQIITM